MYATLGLAPRVIAQQMGWSLASVLKMLEIYRHGDLGALDEMDRAFSQNVVTLHAVRKQLA